MAPERGKRRINERRGELSEQHGNALELGALEGPQAALLVAARLVGGKLRRLDKGTLKGTVTFNQAAIKREKTAIVLEPASDPELAAALRHVCGAVGSKWRVVEPTQGSRPAK